MLSSNYNVAEPKTKQDDPKVTEGVCLPGWDWSLSQKRTKTNTPGRLDHDASTNSGGNLTSSLRLLHSVHFTYTLKLLIYQTPQFLFPIA